MIGVQEEDRQYLRFVWPDVGEGKMKIWRLTKLPFGVNCSPFMLSAVLQHHLAACRLDASPEEKAVIDVLAKSLYVDDAVMSVPKSAEAEKLQEYSVHMLKDAGMDMRKWRGNQLPPNPEAGEKVLGLAQVSAK